MDISSAAAAAVDSFHLFTWPFPLWELDLNKMLKWKPSSTSSPSHIRELSSPTMGHSGAPRKIGPSSSGFSTYVSSLTMLVLCLSLPVVVRAQDDSITDPLEGNSDTIHS